MAREQDQSMEEILQSIKRIIAEEGDAAPSGSDVLELTDLLSEDEADVLLGDAGSKSEPSAGAVPSLSIEEIMAAPIEPEFEPTITAAPPPPPPPAPKPAPVPEVALSAPAPAPAVDDALLSDRTLATSMAALNALKNIPDAPLPPLPTSGLRFRSGTTIEDLVIEALRPMLKDWLDMHLTGIVERMVEKEVRRLSGH